MFFLRLSFASFLWSPARSKKKKRSHAIFEVAWLICIMVFRLFLLPALRGGYQNPNWFPHREVCCEPLCPSPYHNLQGFCVRLPLGLWLLPQILLQKRIGCVLVNFPFLIFKIQQWIICVPLARHSITCDEWAKNGVLRNHRQKTCQVLFLQLFYW